MVLTYNGDVFPSYYHATCAGYTEDAANLWNVDIQPLKGSPCIYCYRSPHFFWTKEIKLKDFEAKLHDGGYNVGSVQSVKVLSKNKSGRADKIEVKDAAGVSYVLTAKDFRQIFGPNVIRSTKFGVYIRSGNVVISGKGWGHGVGMCQWGAFGQSKKGKEYDEILKYYYPGTQITDIKKLPLLK